VIEKLLENWLDSASERSYQAVFVQMLSAQGFRVVHSTRHAATEFGKDVLAIAPDGVGCAYQLKGNPGKRLSLNEFRTEQAQLVQLMSQPVTFPGFPEGVHRSYLVTNGYFEEEVQLAVDQLNRGPYMSKIQLIARGDLLNWCYELGGALWPSELVETKTLLELYLADPAGTIPKQKLFEMLRIVLSLRDGDGIVRRAEFARRVSSAALLTGIAIARFAEAENHQAVMHSWILYLVHVVAASEKHQYQIDGAVKNAVTLAEAGACDALVALWREVASRKYLVEGNPLTDPEIYGWRITTIIGSLTCLAIADEESALLTPEERVLLHNWLRSPPRGIDLWGEAAIANLLPWLVWLRKHDPTIRPDIEIANLFETIVMQNQNKSANPLAAPYYDFDEIAKHRYRLYKIGEDDPFDRETFAGSVYTAEAMLHLAVRTNLKSRCKGVWPRFTRVSHRRFCLDQTWHYCLLIAPGGIDETKVFPSSYEWSKLRSEAISPGVASVPPALSGRPWLLASWWQVAPHRLNTSASHVLAEDLMPSWGS
jgi:hypothetical protein